MAHLSGNTSACASIRHRDSSIMTVLWLFLYSAASLFIPIQETCISRLPSNSDTTGNRERLQVCGFSWYWLFPWNPASIGAYRRHYARKATPFGNGSSCPALATGLLKNAGSGCIHRACCSCFLPGSPCFGPLCGGYSC